LSENVIFIEIKVEAIMNKILILFLKLGLVTGAVIIAYKAGTIVRDEQDVSRESRAVDSAPLCYVENKFSTELQVQVVDSKFASGIYFIQPQKKGIFFCGDELKLINGQYKTKLTLKKSISVEDSKAEKNVTNI
jgi:hypothetical protein